MISFYQEDMKATLEEKGKAIEEEEQRIKFPYLELLKEMEKLRLR
jgi:hypothetical protein